MTMQTNVVQCIKLPTVQIYIAKYKSTEKWTLCEVQLMKKNVLKYAKVSLFPFVYFVRKQRHSLI